VFDIPQNYLENVTHLSVISLSIPPTWYQLANTDYIILAEGAYKTTIKYTDGNYNSKQELLDDLHKKLEAYSPNSYKYTVADSDLTISPKTNGLIITCTTPNALPISIEVPDNHMRIMYGMSQNNTFFNNSLVTKLPINLTPISTLYVHSSACTSFNNGGIFSSDIIASLNIIGGNVSSVNPIGLRTDTMFSLKGNMKVFSGQKNVTFTITDFDNEIIDLNGNNWDIQICLFKYEEEWISKWALYIEYELMKDHIKENNEYGIIQNY
jgi:hypothetical protein